MRPILISMDQEYPWGKSPTDYFPMLVLEALQVFVEQRDCQGNCQDTCLFHLDQLRKYPKEDELDIVRSHLIRGALLIGSGGHCI